MRKSVISTAIIAILLAISLLMGCTPPNIISASGPLVTKDYSLTDFTGVEIGNAFELEITRSDSYSIALTANQSLFDYLEVSKYGQTLKITMKAININLGKATLRAKITMPELWALNLSGATRGDVRGFKSTHELDLRISGASQLTMDGSGGDARLEVTGASKAVLTGLTLNNANIIVSGASRASVNVSGKLDVEVSGASTLEYTGSPTLGNVNVTGASQFKRK